MSDAGGQQEPRRERLEVPTSSSLERHLLVGDAAPPRRPRHKPTIKALPPSGLLGRLQAFLPSLEAANAELQQQLASGSGAEEVAMERGSDDEREGPYVEMDLACGLFDLKDPSAVAAAEAALVNRGVVVEAYEGGSTSGSDSDTSDGSSSDSEEEGEEEGEQEADGEGWARQAQGGGGGAAAAAAGPQQNGAAMTGPNAAAAAAADAGGDVMEEDEAAGEGSLPATAGAAAAAGAANAAPGRRRQKQKRGKRHAGIVELS